MEKTTTSDETKPQGIIRDHLPNTETLRSAQEAPGSKIHHDTFVATAHETQNAGSPQAEHARKITIQLSDFGVPSMTHDLNRPAQRVSCSDTDCLAFLKKITDGQISNRVVETDTKGATAMISTLEMLRTNLRNEFAAYAEIPVHDVIGTIADDLERKLYARHFRNKEAQHRVFMIAFSVALVCVVGAIISDTFIETTLKLTDTAEIIGVAITLLGIIGHLLMRFGDARNEKRAARSIQELALLDNVIEKFHIAIR